MQHRPVLVGRSGIRLPNLIENDCHWHICFPMNILHTRWYRYGGSLSKAMRCTNENILRVLLGRMGPILRKPWIDDIQCQGVADTLLSPMMSAPLLVAVIESQCTTPSLPDGFSYNWFGTAVWVSCGRHASLSEVAEAADMRLVVHISDFPVPIRARPRALGGSDSAAMDVDEQVVVTSASASSTTISLNASLVAFGTALWRKRWSCGGGLSTWTVHFDDEHHRLPSRISFHEVAQRFSLIPVDSVGEVAGVVCEVEDEENTGGNGVNGTPNNDMTDEGMIFEKTHKDSSYLEPHVQSRVKCACVRPVRYCLYTPRRVHGSCYCLDAKLPEKRSQDNKWSFSLSRQWLRSCCWRLCTSFLLQVEGEDHGVVIFAILESASLAIGGPKISPFWGGRRWEILWPVETQPLQMLSDCWIQCVILSCSLFYWNMRYSFAFSLLKADKRLCWWFINRSLTRWSCWFIGINASHIDSCYFVLVVGKVHESWCNRGTWRTSPSIRSPHETLDILRFLPSVQYRGVFAAFLYSSFCIHGFVMIFWPWIVITVQSSWNDVSGTVR